MSLDSLTLFVRLLTPSRIIFFHFSFMFIFLYLFLNLFIYLYSVTIVCTFSPSQFHIYWPYVGSKKSASVGILTAQKTANATNERFSSSVEPVVKYHHTATSIPNIFKTCSLLHFLRVVFNLVGVRRRARSFKKRQTAVCTLKNIPRKSDVVHVYITSLPQTPPKHHCVSCIADGLKI